MHFKGILARNRAKIREKAPKIARNRAKKKGRGAFRYIKKRFFRGGIFVEIQLILKFTTFSFLRSNQRILS